MNMLMDIAIHLQQNGIGIIGEDIRLSQIPEDGPDELTALFDYAGLPLNDMDSEFYQLSLQVQSRGADYEAALGRAQAVQTVLKDVGNSIKGIPSLTIGNTIYFKLSALQPPFKLREDENGRIYFSQNYRVQARNLR